MKLLAQTLLLSLFVLPLSAQNTEFAPIGARWIAYGAGAWQSDIITEVSTVVGDTLLAGHICSVIQLDWHDLCYDELSGETTLCHHYNERREYVYAQGSQVYYYRDGASYILYNFGAQVGDTWEIKSRIVIDGHPSTGTIRVDSIGTEVVDGVPLRYLWVSPTPGSCYSYNYGSTKILERVGATNGTIFPDYPVNTCSIVDSFWSIFSCYEDADIFYKNQSSTWQIDTCSIVISTQAPISPQSNRFECQYNASQQSLILSSLQQTEARFTLYDLQGKLVATQAMTPYQSNYNLALPALPTGIYVYTFANKHGITEQKGKLVIYH